MSRRVIDVLVMTDSHRSLGHHVVLTDVNLSAVLLCHTVNIPARYKHHKIALSIRTTILTDVSARMSRQTNYHQSLRQFVAPTEASLSAVLFCHTVNISARYKHCKIVLSIRTTILTDVSAWMSRQTNYHRRLGYHVAPSEVILSTVLLCHTVNISARCKHCTIALPISATMITDVLASYRCLGDDGFPSVLRASCSADRCESLGGLTLSHSEYPGEIQALQDSIVNQDNRCDRHLGEDISADQLPSAFRASCSADRCESLGGLTLSHGEYPMLSLLQMSWRVTDILARTSYHQSLGHLHQV